MEQSKTELSRKRLTLQRKLIILLTFFPLFYVLVLTQYSAITVPFWDHSELIHWLVPIFDGDFRFLDLLKPHNHTRPLVYRLVMLFNARLTDWDIRSEYIYMLMSIYGTFAIHFWALRRLTINSIDRRVFPITILLVSLILFSPVGHNNHWWSMMFQLNATNLFVAFGLLVAFIGPTQITNQVLAAISLWLASFTLTNGLFAILAVIITFQISSRKWFIPSKLALFWCLNLLVILSMYLPGLSSSGSSERPSIQKLIQFIPTYLGSPLAGLLRFPFKNIFDIPTLTGINALVGWILLLTSVLLIRHSYKRGLIRKSSTLVLIGFSVFALVSSLVTAWGRASFDDFGVANANASRYSIFAAYLLLGQIYYVSTTFFTGKNLFQAENPQSPILSRQIQPLYRNKFLPRFLLGKIINFALIIFVTLSFISYVRGIRVYVDAHEFNKQLASRYTWNNSSTELDKIIHPDPELVMKLKTDLQRLELGPYRNRAFNRENLGIGEFKEFGLLVQGGQYSQRFIATDNRLKAVLVTLVKPNGGETDGRVTWMVSEFETGLSIMSGIVDASKIKDWEFVRLKLPFLESSKGFEYVLTLSSDAPSSNALGVALYNTEEFNLASQVMFTEGIRSTVLDLTMNIGLDYVD